jgi:hypothetical protein
MLQSIFVLTLSGHREKLSSLGVKLWSWRMMTGHLMLSLHLLASLHVKLVRHLWQCNWLGGCYVWVEYCTKANTVCKTIAPSHILSTLIIYVYSCVLGVGCVCFDIRALIVQILVVVVANIQIRTIELPELVLGEDPTACLPSQPVAMIKSVLVNIMGASPIYGSPWWFSVWLPFGPRWSSASPLALGPSHVCIHMASAAYVGSFWPWSV